MSVPLDLMPGGGGPPAPAPPGMDGGAMGGNPMGGGGGGGIDILKLLAGFQKQPSPDAEKKMIQDASVMTNGAYPKVQLRSAKAARLLMEANAKLQSALEALAQEGQRALNAPPDLGGGQTPVQGGF